MNQKKYDRKEDKSSTFRRFELMSTRTYVLAPSNLTLSVGWLGGWVVGDLESKAISASNLKLKLIEAELGNNPHTFYLKFCISINPLICKVFSAAPPSFLPEKLSLFIKTLVQEI